MKKKINLPREPLSFLFPLGNRYWNSIPPAIGNIRKFPQNIATNKSSPSSITLLRELESQKKTSCSRSNDFTFTIFARVWFEDVMRTEKVTWIHVRSRSRRSDRCATRRRKLIAYVKKYLRVKSEAHRKRTRRLTYRNTKSKIIASKIWIYVHEFYYE